MGRLRLPAGQTRGPGQELPCRRAPWPQGKLPRMSSAAHTPTAAPSQGHGHPSLNHGNGIAIRPRIGPRSKANAHATVQRPELGRIPLHWGPQMQAALPPRSSRERINTPAPTLAHRHHYKAPQGLWRPVRLVPTKNCAKKRASLRQSRPLGVTAPAVLQNHSGQYSGPSILPQYGRRRDISPLNVRGPRKRSNHRGGT